MNAYYNPRFQGLAGLFIAVLVNVQPYCLKIADAIVATAPAPPISNQVVVVDIDEHSLASWGQWPWPRSRLARLLGEINRMEAKSIALDFIMAEPDRRSASVQPEEPPRHRDRQPENLSHPPPPDTPSASDTVLAAALANGPFVLGFSFMFGDQAQDYTNCTLPPLEIIDIRRPSDAIGYPTFHEAQSAVCNMAQLARSAPYAGFLNGHTDSDGVLRRLPLIIYYQGAAYPNLALAALLATLPHQPVRIDRHQGAQCCLLIGPHTIPVDDNGNLTIRFTDKGSSPRHIPASQVLAGQVDPSVIRDKVVLVGLSAAGLAPSYQTPAGGRITGVDVHAQAIETILSGQTIHRPATMVGTEILLALLVAVLFGLCIARLEFFPTIIVGGTGIFALGVGAHLLFISRQMLILPFLPAVVIITGGPLLMLFKYWTRQRKAVRQLTEAMILIKNNEKNLNSIIKTIPDIVFRLNASGHITFVSPAVAKYKKPPETLMGRHILDLVAEDDRAMATYRINERRTGSRATIDMEVRLLLSPNGEEDGCYGRYFSVSAEGIYSQGQPSEKAFVGTQGIAKDIDERKRLEQRLERSKKMEAIGSLAAGVAHDLNNILSGIVSYPELLLLDLPEESPMRGKIEIIQRSGQRAADIVQDLLMIARRGVRDHLIVNVNQIVNSYVKTPECERLLENHPETRITTDLADDLMNTRGSVVHILKMIMNLVGNAAEAMPAGGAICLSTRNRYLDVEVNRYERINEGEYVVLRIADEGVGISREDLHRIFEPFYSKKRMGRSGSGLGMTVVWNTVKDHNGFVDIQSREGEGTRFDIFLPATREKIGKTPQRTVLQDYTGSETVLVVDDVKEQREIAVRMLGKLGYRVTSVPSGEAAIAHIRSGAVDLVVLDMVMPPGMDGLEAYEKILTVRPGQRAIIASGYAPSERVKAMQDLGAGSYVRKPYTLEKIGMAVRQELDKK
ncbi:CHASE2 domain-containing protein [Desulfosarcina ovata]|uniref:CHASE2 domain-containing protein n=1 Tax=Desulfosarcina ovata TaxID=83564 RepID=UPI0012D36807|nr:CHASE2 domain-containing protein [Desulfosarcina ovata]